MTTTYDRATRIDSQTVEVITAYSGNTNDQIIVIREAVHALRNGTASKINVTVHAKDWSLTIKARK